MLVSASIDYIQLIAVFMQRRNDAVDVIVVMGLNSDCQNDFLEAVDLRAESKTYGKWYGIELTEENKKQFLVPAGFAHGFLVLSDIAEFCYKVTDFYHPNDEGGIAWNDPELGVKWPQVYGEYPGSADASEYRMEDGTKLSLSAKDQVLLGLKDTFKF